MRYAERLQALKHAVRDEGLEALIVVSKVNRQYLSGFTGSAGVLVVTARSARLFVDDRYTLRARDESFVSVAHSRRLPVYLDTLKGRVGVEDTISLREFHRLKKQVRGVRWVVTRSLVEQVRMVKEAGELRLIARGSTIIDAAFQAVVTLLKDRRRGRGVTELEIAHLIDSFGRSHGAEGLAFDSIVAWGAHAAAPHHLPSTTAVGTHNFLLLDFGMKVGGYHSDFTRTLFVGTPTKRHEQVYAAVLEAQERALAAVRVDGTAHEVDGAARLSLASHSLDQYFTHFCGHGVGLEIHELPNFSPDSEDVLREGVVATVEPGVYIPGKFGIRIEDMVVVRNKPKILSKIPKDFERMIIR